MGEFHLLNYREGRRGRGLNGQRNSRKMDRVNWSSFEARTLFRELCEKCDLSEITGIERMDIKDEPLDVTAPIVLIHTPSAVVPVIVTYCAKSQLLIQSQSPNALVIQLDPDTTRQSLKKMILEALALESR